MPGLNEPDSVRWVAEGAGGVLVPINESESMVDLMSAMGMPVLVVARSSLGTINHTLLTIESLRRRKLEIWQGWSWWVTKTRPTATPLNGLAPCRDCGTALFRRHSHQKPLAAGQRRSLIPQGQLARYFK